MRYTLPLLPLQVPYGMTTTFCNTNSIELA